MTKYEHNKLRDSKRAERREAEKRFIRSLGLSFDELQNGARLKFTNGRVIVDYYPTTGRAKVRGTDLTGEGVEDLLFLLENAKPVPTDNSKKASFHQSYDRQYFDLDRTALFNRAIGAFGACRGAC